MRNPWNSPPTFPSLTFHFRYGNVNDREEVGDRPSFWLIFFLLFGLLSRRKSWIDPIPSLIHYVHSVGTPTVRKVNRKEWGRNDRRQRNQGKYGRSSPPESRVTTCHSPRVNGMKWRETVARVTRLAPLRFTHLVTRRALPLPLVSLAERPTAEGRR